MPSGIFERWEGAVLRREVTAWEDVCVGFRLSRGSVELMYRKFDGNIRCFATNTLACFGADFEKYVRAEANAEDVWTRWRRRMRFVGEMRRMLQTCCQDWARKTERLRN